MSVNKYRPHILLLPEDDANNEIVNGFLLEPSLNLRSIQSLPVAGGWTAVRDEFVEHHVKPMRKWQSRVMVLLIDFDDQVDRMAKMKSVIPDDLADRVFILGAKNEPEDLKKAGFSSFESIGRQLAKECVNGTDSCWSHDLLRQNAVELKRLRNHVKSFLFSDA